MNFKHILIIAVFFILFHGGFISGVDETAEAGLADVLNSSDYTYLWWANGYPAPRAQGKQVYCFQSGLYGFAFDTEKVDFIRFGEIDKNYTAQQAAAQDNEIVYGLDKSQLTLTVKVDGKTYTCAGQTGIDKKPVDRSLPEFNPGVGYGHKNVPQRIISSGRYLQRFDVMYVQFADPNGNLLEADGRVEVIAWPDSVTIIMEIIPKMTMEKVSFGLELKSGDKTLLSSSSRVIPIPEGRTTKYSQTVTFSQEETGSLKMAALDEKGKVLETRYDKILNAYVIDVPPDMLKKGKMGDEPIAVNLKIKNPTEDIQTARLFFSTEPRGKECAIVGTTPFLADSQGNPLGVAMQISKNWHRQPDHKILYEGSWYYAYAVLHAQPGKSYGLKYMILNGVWGDVPSVSHAQLCLIGWGGNQLWDQVAIGNWGETITYDPEVGLNRAVIDDVRPLMVSSIGSKPNVKWGWTNNVGGGDFLVYVDKEGKRQPVVAAKSNYQMIGPNLSKVTYSGFTADKAIACKMTVMTPRCDDINRNWHSFRYDVLKPVEFSRLAFYQMGADRYNDNAFDYMAVGDSKGLSKQFEPVKGGLEYSVKNEKCGNKLPWLAIYGAGYVGKTENRKGAVANRGLIVRSWKAKLSGREISAPSYSVYGTEDQAKSALFELSAPSSVKKLLPGDFVECEVEFIVLPQFADDYYGPNENLKKFLKENENTWKPVYREAVGNDLDVDVSVGKLIKLYPVEIELGTEQKATFKVAGGIGYVPMIFSGLKDYKGMKLLEIKNGERVDCRDNERYQSNYDIENQTWSVIFNIDLDTQADNRMEREFEFVTGG